MKPFFTLLLWINRIVFLLLVGFIAGDIFDNKYGTDDYDPEVGNNLAIVTLTTFFIPIEILFQCILRTKPWYVVLGIASGAFVGSIVTMMAMEGYYHTLPICSRMAPCAWEPGSPYMESQIPDQNKRPRR
jgi:hypothetical protein